MRAIAGHRLRQTLGFFFVLLEARRTLLAGLAAVVFADRRPGAQTPQAVFALAHLRDAQFPRTHLEAGVAGYANVFRFGTVLLAQRRLAVGAAAFRYALHFTGFRALQGDPLVIRVANPTKRPGFCAALRTHSPGLPVGAVANRVARVLSPVQPIALLAVLALRGAFAKTLLAGLRLAVVAGADLHVAGAILGLGISRRALDAI